jgi:hypothetical protein
MKYEVRVMRTSYAHVFLTVEAETEHEAQEKAMDEAMSRFEHENYDEYDSSVEAEIVEKYETQRINFEYEGESYYVSFTPEESDWWTSVMMDGKMFDIHYDEDDMTISVYTMLQDDNGNWDTNTSKSVYSTTIKK